MKARNRKLLLQAVVCTAIYALVKLSAAFVLMPSQVPFAHFDDSSQAAAVMYILLQPFILVGAIFCGNRLVPAGTDNDEAPDAANDDEYLALHDDPEDAGSKN